MELRQLRYLQAIADEGNFTRAAEKVFVSQSALSQQIQSLEQEIGTILLDRSKRGVRLTAAGEVLYHHAIRAFNELGQARTAIDELEGIQRGELTIGVVQTVNAYFIPTLITAFTGMYPRIKLRIEELSSDEIEARLNEGTLQVGISFTPVATDMIDSQDLFEERLVLVTRADHPLADQVSVSVKQLDGLPMVMLAKSFCTRRLWEENARLSNAQPQIMLEMNTVSSILSVVEKTGLATVLPQMSMADKATDHLRALPLHDPMPSRQVGLLWARNVYLCSASRAFIEEATRLTKPFLKLMRERYIPDGSASH